MNSAPPPSGLRVGYVEAPQEWTSGRPAIFLAGGITACPDWQATARVLLNDGKCVVLNPRRADFPIHDPSAAPVQIAWEFRHLHRADVVLFWFAGGSSPQPIALYELGRHAALGRPLAVGCDPDYLRWADVRHQLHHARPDVPVWTTLAQTCRHAWSLLPEPEPKAEAHKQNLSGGRSS